MTSKTEPRLLCYDLGEGVTAFSTTMLTSSCGVVTIMMPSTGSGRRDAEARLPHRRSGRRHHRPLHSTGLCDPWPGGGL